MTKIKGVALTLAGAEYIVPALSLGALELLQDRIEAFNGAMTKESVATVIDCLHAALGRNYPEMTRAQAADLVDVENFSEVMGAVMNTSGMVRGAADPNAPAPAQAGAT